MKYLIRVILLSLFFLSGKNLSIYASSISFDNCIPESGSEITDFKFTLVFNIEEAISQLGNDYGLGYSGTTSNSRNMRTNLYEGTPEGEHVLLAKTMTSNFNGTSDGFIAGNNKIVINFPETLKPEKGKDYYLEIGNTFALYKIGQTASDPDARIIYYQNPLILRFKGRAATSSELVIQNVSISDSEVIESLSDISYTFNEPIKITSNPCVNIVGADGTSVSITSALIQSDGKTVTFSVSPAINLLRKQPYDIVLQEGSVCLQADESVISKSVTIKVTGNYATSCKVSETSIINNTIGLFKKLTVTFDVPQGLTLVPPRPNIDIPLNGYLYKSTVSDENLVSSFKYEATASNTIEWNMADVPFEPETRYIFVKNKNDITLFNENGVSVPYYGNERVEIAWTTPSVAESGIPQFEFQTPEVFAGSKNSYAYKENMKMSNISSIRLTLKDYNYIYEGNSYKLARRISNQIPQCQIYEVTGNGDVLLYDMYVDTEQRETSKGYYNSISASVDLQLLEGKKYKVVIPEGLFVPQNMPALNEYVQNPRFEFLFEGAGSTEITPTGCNIQSDANMHEVYNVIWSFDKSISLAGENPKAQYNIKRANGTEYTSTKDLLLNDIYARYYLRADMSDFTNGKPTTISKDDILTIIVPEGSICYTTDPSLVNKEFSIVINGKDLDSIVTEPEFVNTNVFINGFHSTSLEAVKGRKLNISLIPDGNWVVTSLTRDGNDVLPFLQENDGVYTTPALTADTKIEATIEYDGVIINDIASDVVEIPETSVKVYSDGEHIVVDGISAGDVVAVYSANGMLIAEQTMNASDRAMQITIAKGQIYIVRVNDKAVKIQH